MPSVAIAPAAPIVGAAASKLAALHVTLARLEAMFPPRRQAPPPARAGSRFAGFCGRYCCAGPCSFRSV